MNKDINKWRSPILVMIAMEMEADILIDRLENKRTKKIYKFTFYEWTILNYPVVICLSDVGTRNASIATYIAINIQSSLNERLTKYVLPKYKPVISNKNQANKIEQNIITTFFIYNLQ